MSANVTYINNYTAHFAQRRMGFCVVLWITFTYQISNTYEDKL